MKERFSKLLCLAEEQLRLHPGADQVIAIETRSQKIRWFANTLGTDAEDRFAELLSQQSDSAAALLVCMWADGTIDLPSMHLRRLLLELDPENEDTLLLLQADSGPITRTIGWSMPYSLPRGEGGPEGGRERNGET